MSSSLRTCSTDKQAFRLFRHCVKAGNSPTLSQALPPVIIHLYSHLLFRAEIADYNTSGGSFHIRFAITRSLTSYKDAQLEEILLQYVSGDMKDFTA
jgi:hypothetical protein